MCNMMIVVHGFIFKLLVKSFSYENIICKLKASIGKGIRIPGTCILIHACIYLYNELDCPQTK